MQDDDLADRLLATFLDELDEQIRVLSSDLLQLETHPADAERLRSVFRVFHTLKGAARAADVPLIEGASHRLEGMLSAARDGHTSLKPAQLDLLFRAAAAFEDAGRRIRAHCDLTDSPLMLLDRQLRNVGPSIPSESARESVAFGATETAASRGAARDATDPTDPTDPTAQIRKLPPPTLALAQEVATATPRPTDTTTASAAAPAPRDPAVAAAQEADEHVRVGVYRIDAMINAANDVVTLASAINDRRKEASALQTNLARGRLEWRKLLQQRLETRLDPDGRGALRAVLEAMDDEVRQIARECAQLARSLAHDADRLVSTAASLLRDARDLRLRPISDITAPLQRTVRELSRTLSKPVKLEVTGENTEADRTVLDRLREPLLHLIRNAVDHGIEPAAERERLNKPAEGTITIAATVAGDRLVITVADDGSGLDLAAIRARLAQQGRPVPRDPVALAAALFDGGFSTKSATTEISGRGVGLDVVRTQVENLGGTVSVRWVEHAGTTFTLDVPVTLASIRVVLVAVGDQTVAIPTGSIERLRLLRGSDVREIDGRAFLIGSDRGHESGNGSGNGSGNAPIPLASLAALLGPPLTERTSDDTRRVVQLASQNTRLALVVDAIMDEREVMLRPLEHRAGTSLLSGGALLPEGGVALIINVPALLASATGRTRTAAQLAPFTSALARSAAPKNADKKRARILVVDDSITTRTLEESVLRAAGYDVVTATDGADAWRSLQASPDDLVISDVEMPRMDGIALCEAIKASPTLKNTPVILVTSLDRPEHIQRGLAAGADAYVPKSSFDQDTLLGMIHQLLGDDNP